MSSQTAPARASAGTTSTSTSTSTSTPNAATKRLIHEIQDNATTPNAALLHLGPVSDDDLFHWEAVLRGVRGTPYEGGLWLLTIRIPAKYPLEPPGILFVTPICHPNIHFGTGEICLTLLTAEHWTPSYTISTTLSAVQQLLDDPTPESPLNIDIANLYREDDRLGAEALVRYWTGERRWAGEGKGFWVSEKRAGTSGKIGEAYDEGPKMGTMDPKDDLRRDYGR